MNTLFDTDFSSAQVMELFGNKDEGERRCDVHILTREVIRAERILMRSGRNTPVSIRAIFKAFHSIHSPAPTAAIPTTYCAT